MNDTKNQACPRIYTKCPACHNDTLTINDDKHLICTWHDCKDPTLIDRVSELVRAGDRAHKAGGEPEELKVLASATGSASAAAKRIVIEVDEKSVTVTRPNEMTERENDRLDYGLRQAIKVLRDLRETQPMPNRNSNQPK